MPSGWALQLIDVPDEQLPKLVERLLRDVIASVDADYAEENLDEVKEWLRLVGHAIVERRHELLMLRLPRLRQGLGQPSVHDHGALDQRAHLIGRVADLFQDLDAVLADLGRPADNRRAAPRTIGWVPRHCGCAPRSDARFR
ncbi:MAG: hypothetical protein WDO24_18900 [Pseudomonadota bacterium]